MQVFWGCKDKVMLQLLRSLQSSNEDETREITQSVQKIVRGTQAGERQWQPIWSQLQKHFKMWNIQVEVISVVSLLLCRLCREYGGVFCFINLNVTKKNTVGEILIRISQLSYSHTILGTCIFSYLTLPMKYFVFCFSGSVITRTQCVSII